MLTVTKTQEHIRGEKIAKPQLVIVDAKTRLKHSFTYRLIRAIVIMVVLGVGFFFFYKYLAPGILVVDGDQKGYKIEVGNKKYENVNGQKIVFLKRGTYVLTVSKDGFREFNDVVLIKPLRKVKEKVVFSKSSYINTLQGGEFDNISLSDFKDNSLIYFSKTDNNFYQTSPNSTNMTIASGLGTSLNIDLGLVDGDIVNNVKYSPSKTQAFVLITDVDGNNLVKLVDFNSKTAHKLDLNLQDIDWLTDNQAVGIRDNNGLKLVTLSSNGGSLHEVIGISGDIASVYRTSDPQKVVVTFSANNIDTVAFVNLNSGHAVTSDFKEGLVSKIISSPNNDYTLVYVYANLPKTFLLHSNGDKEPININPYFGLMTWETSGQSFIYAELSNNQYIFNEYNLANKNTKDLEKYSSTEGDPSNLIISQNNLNFILGRAIMGFKL